MFKKKVQPEKEAPAKYVEKVAEVAEEQEEEETETYDRFKVGEIVTERQEVLVDDKGTTYNITETLAMILNKLDHIDDILSKVE